MRKARTLNPRNKDSVVGDRLIVNGKRYYHYTIPKRWLDRDANENSVVVEDESQDGTPESQDGSNRDSELAHYYSYYTSFFSNTEHRASVLFCVSNTHKH